MGENAKLIEPISDVKMVLVNTGQIGVNLYLLEEMHSSSNGYSTSAGR
jgi:hypothetical protein